VIRAFAVNLFQDLTGIVIRDGAVYQDGVRLASDRTALAYRLLEYLCRHAGEKVCTKEDLDDYLWPDETNSTGTERLTQLIKRLREKIGDKEKTEKDCYICVVHGRGYQFVQPATGR
jgi:DNA-binding winged helix-turn-helix (wHTH) protein